MKPGDNKTVSECTNLKEECVWSVRLEGGSGGRGLLDAAGQGELDAVVVHLLDEGPLAVLGGDWLNAQDLEITSKM